MALLFQHLVITSGVYYYFNMLQNATIYIYITVYICYRRENIRLLYILLYQYSNRHQLGSCHYQSTSCPRQGHVAAAKRLRERGELEERNRHETDGCRKAQNVMGV